MKIIKTSEKDLNNVKSLWANGEVMHYVGYPDGFKITYENLLVWLDKINKSDARAHFSIYDNNAYCGELFYSISHDLIATIDIKILPQFWNRGLGSRAFDFLINTVFSTTNATKCKVDPHKDNLSAIKLYERAGFKYISDADETHLIYHLEKPHLYRYQFVYDSEIKAAACVAILNDLPDWFGISESTAEYVNDVKSMETLICFDHEDPIGLITLNASSEDTLEIHLMAIKKDYHRKGIGKALIMRAHDFALKHDFSYLMVKTLADSHPDIYYAETRKFYRRSGFKKLLVDSLVWGSSNPCLIMIKHRDFL